MAFSTRERTEATLSEINVTPLVDVVLVLLIIFMVTAPMLSASHEVQLQRATAAPAPNAKEHLMVTVDAQGRIFVADDSSKPEDLAEKVKAKLNQTKLEHVAIRGDKSVSYGTVLEVLDRLRAAKIQNVGLVMLPPEPVRDGRK